MFTAFAINKIAMPYNVTVILKSTFRAFKRVVQHRRRAAMFQRRSLLCRAMRALTLYQVKEMKVKTIQERLQTQKMAQVFDAFIDQCLIMQDLRLKCEELQHKSDANRIARSYNHWFTLCQDRLHF